MLFYSTGVRTLLSFKNKTTQMFISQMSLFLCECKCELIVQENLHRIKTCGSL